MVIRHLGLLEFSLSIFLILRQYLHWVFSLNLAIFNLQFIKQWSLIKSPYVSLAIVVLVLSDRTRSRVWPLLYVEKFTFFR